MVTGIFACIFCGALCLCENGKQSVLAEVPFAEMTDYVVALRAMTQGRGRFTFEFDRYEEAPAEIAQKIIEERKNEIEE